MLALQRKLRRTKSASAGCARVGIEIEVAASPIGEIPILPARSDVALVRLSFGSKIEPKDESDLSG